MSVGVAGGVGVVTGGVIVVVGVTGGHVGFGVTGGHVGFGFSGSLHAQSQQHLQQLFTTILITVWPFSQHDSFVSVVIAIPFSDIRLLLSCIIIQLYGAT